MPRTIPVEVRIADLPRMEQFISAVAELLRVLAKCSDLPGPVMAAAEDVHLAIAVLGGHDTGASGDENHIRTAMNVATQNPGRIVTVSDREDG